MSKKLNPILYSELAEIIESGKRKVTQSVNSTIVLVYWHVGFKINKYTLNNKRAVYADETVSQVAAQLEANYGKSFSLRNVRRMVQFANEFPDFEKVSPLAAQLSWSHDMELLPIKNTPAKYYYIGKINDERWSRNTLKMQIQRKSFERNQIANLQTKTDLQDLQNTFKAPYFLYFLGLKDGYLENDLETVIVKEIENFILKLGIGFSFIERQKRIILDVKSFYFDLLFYHRKLKRLVVIELKIGEFKPAYKGQMELYLKWLNKNEKQEGENNPIGLILGAGKSNEQIELLEMHKDGIMVA